MHASRSTPSLLRRTNPRVIFAVFFLGFVGYYTGRLSTSGSRPPPPPTSRNVRGVGAGVVPEPQVVEAEPLTVTVRPPQVTVQGPQVTVQAPQATVTVTTEVFIPKADIPEEPVVLNGPPTQAFQDNLRPDVQYITVWPGSGFTNDVMSFMNLIYLSILTQRVPIMPFFTPTHVAKLSSVPVPPIDFGVVFDVPRLAKGLGKPVIEWWQVKDRNSTTIDPLGCWNVWQAVGKSNKGPHFTTAPKRLNVDVSWTIAPNWIKLFKDSPEEPHMRFTSLMALSFPEMRRKNLKTPSKSPILKTELPPDDHLVCFDDMYWTANVEPHEFQHDYSTSWRFVGKHLHWNPRIEGLARQYIRQTFGLSTDATIPSYITIHVRHGDFGGWCRRPLDECFAPLSAIARRVDEVKAELKQTKGITAQHVIITSDEKNSTWWDTVAPYGWYRVDHSTTVATYGAWYPLLIDAAIQSGGMGLVGTDLSTVSMIAGHRVKAWQDGAVRMVKWGKPGADDH
ncbi:hypothetical protein MVEN_01582800 [Mycena venus]|uniref:Uncharacterized protein n=1 Tax=Mycena venus TaxID=2733690 RepID=A0A8H6XSH3_9AGAR|nr:hypothetical protein MVEN_01582800 [Mycena venus]